MARHSVAADGFWRFSLMVYARPGTADALIGLQDGGGHNVNLLLYGLWLGICAAHRLDAAALSHAEAAIKRIDRDIVAPLRRLRRELKNDPASDVCDLRRRVLSLEISAERRVQARLATIDVPQQSAEMSDCRDAAEANLRLILGGDFASDNAAPLRDLIASF